MHTHPLTCLISTALLAMRTRLADRADPAMRSRLLVILTPPPSRRTISRRTIMSWGRAEAMVEKRAARPRVLVNIILNVGCRD